ncbi:ArsC/Spx/MgsR family protein [Engelhardtia mirabilis]|uniref:Arsenate reductase n=1 Tax=Engelhardtia mirabilis TaxID=2528011 RepID=A0A518BEW4_9BACT|nr:Arsenate reductase [Planctomycetes bacterium Pla133]QDU99855.1 Arsenate reductase [Planctomycetes bacterium Pla86]
MTLPTDDGLLLLHNPACSKSRALEQALRERGVAFTTRLYLDQPLDEVELADLIRRLGVQARDIVRSGEPQYADAGLHPRSETAAILDAVACYPQLLQRPVLLRGERAAIGRPLEAALELL